MDNNLKRSIILQHYQSPINKGLIEDNTYIKINMDNESCVDQIDLMIKINNDIITDIKFDGEACAICTSSTSIMIETLLNKTIEQAKEIIKNFENLIDEKEYNEEILESAIVYDEIYKQPNRKKCALLSWWGIKKVLEENKCKD